MRTKFQTKGSGNTKMTNFACNKAPLKTTTTKKELTYLHDLVNEGWQVGPFKRFLQARHLVQDTAQCPDVRLVAVRFPFTLNTKPE